MTCNVFMFSGTLNPTQSINQQRLRWSTFSSYSQLFVESRKL